MPMNSLSRTVFFLIVVIIVIAGIIVAVRYFNQQGQKEEPSIKTLTISDNGEFDQDNLIITNDEKLRIKNDDDQKVTVKRVDTGETIAEVEPNTTSSDIDLPDDTRVELQISEKPEERSKVEVGSPAAITTPEPPGETQNRTTNADNLPTTGAESWIYPLLLALGLLILPVAPRLLKPVKIQLLPKYLKTTRWKS